MAISLPEAKFRSILIPVNADQQLMPWEMVDVASRLAREGGGLIAFFVFSLTPLSEELDVETPALEARLRRLVARPPTLAGRYGIDVRWSHRRIRDAAA